MERPDLATLACVNVECQHYGQSGFDRSEYPQSVWP